MNYYVTSEIHPSLEDWYNAGLSRDRAKELIEEIRDLGPTPLNLRCESSGINGNWTVSTVCSHPEDIEHLVKIIKNKLNKEIGDSYVRYHA